MNFFQSVSRAIVILGLVFSVQANAQEGTFAVESVSGVPSKAENDFSGVDLQDVINRGFGPQDLVMYQASLDNGSANDYTNGCQHEESQNCYQLTRDEFAPVYNLENQCGTLYANVYATCANAVAQGYGFTPEDVTLWTEASGSLNTAACNSEYGVDCDQITKTEYTTMLGLLANCGAYTSAPQAFAPTDYQSCKDAIAEGYNYSDADVALWDAAHNTAVYDAGCQYEHSAACNTLTRSEFELVKTTVTNCSGYPSYSDCQTATVTNGYSYSVADVALWNDALDNATYGAACQLDHSAACTTLTLVEFTTLKSNYQACSNYSSYTACNTAAGLGYGVGDYALYAEAVGGSKDATCQANYSLNCSDLTITQYNAVEGIAATANTAATSIASAITGGSPITASDLQDVLASTGASADSDVDLTNALHLSFIEDCIGDNASLSNIESCTTSVDGTALNKHVVVEIAGGASGTVDNATLQAAGIDSAVASVAISNDCGPNQDQNCFDVVLASGLTTGTLTTAAFTTALLDYFEDAVDSEPTAVATASGTTGCSNGQTIFAVPNPPTLCSSFANWNCTGITPGIQVVWNDSGKGNIQADSTVFSGGAYQVRATLTVGSQSRQKTLNGTFNMSAAVAGAANGYKTASDPGYWGNPFNPLARAKSRCEGWGGTLATHAEIRAANSAHGTIISNGTRVIFRAANGDATAYTGSGSTTKPQCSNDFYQTGSNNIKGFTYKWNNNAYCDGKAKSENFTSLCKDIPSC